MDTYEFIIEVYNETPDKKKEKVVKELQRFFMTLSDKTVEKVAETKDKKDRIKILKGSWDMFKKSINKIEYAEKTEQMACDAEKEWCNIRGAKNCTRNGEDIKSPHHSSTTILASSIDNAS